MATHDSPSTPTEQTRLLPEDNGAENTEVAPEASTSELPTVLRLEVIIACVLILLLIGISLLLVSGPTAPIFEALVCQTFFPDVIDPASDPRCRSSTISSALANLYSWQLMVAYLPSVLLSVPYGIMADRRGRKLVMVLALLGIVLYYVVLSIIASFPGKVNNWWSVVLGLFFLIGGGPAVATTMVFTMVGDVTPAAQKATVFFYLNAAVLSGFLIATPLLAWLLRKGNWLPYFIGLTGTALAAVLAMMLPETRHPDMIERSSSSGNIMTEPGSSKRSLGALWTSFTSSISSSFAAIRKYCFNNKKAAVLLLAITFNIFGHDVVILTVMYTAKVFDLSWSDATALSTINLAMAIAMLLVVLPLANQLLVKWFSMGVMKKDLTLARISIVFLVVGYTAQGLAPTVPSYIVALVISTIGLGFPAMLRSLITAYTGGQDLGTLYSMITVIENLGALVAGPTMMQLFSLGISKGGHWKGLPFYFAGGLLAVSMITVFLFSLPSEQEEVPEEHTERREEAAMA